MKLDVLMKINNYFVICLNKCITRNVSSQQLCGPYCTVYIWYRG